MVGFDWATCHTLLQRAMWTRGLWEGSSNNLSRSGGQSNPAFLPMTPARQKATHHQWPGRLSTPRSLKAESGEREKQAENLVFCVGLFWTPIYGFNWQVLQQKVQRPHRAPSMIIYTVCRGGLDWLMQFIFYIFPHSSSTLPAGLQPGARALYLLQLSSRWEKLCCPEVETQRKPFIA